jgi:hypothetical protein
VCCGDVRRLETLNQKFQELELLKPELSNVK